MHIYHLLLWKKNSIQPRGQSIVLQKIKMFYFEEPGKEKKKKTAIYIEAPRIVSLEALYDVRSIYHRAISRRMPSLHFHYWWRSCPPRVHNSEKIALSAATSRFRGEEAVWENARSADFANVSFHREFNRARVNSRWKLRNVHTSNFLSIRVYWRSYGWIQARASSPR